MRARKKLLKLPPPAISQDTVQALEFLVEEAKAGRVIGVAWVALHPLYKFSVDAAGETRRSPTFTRGVLRVLDDALSKLSE